MTQIYHLVLHLVKKSHDKAWKEINTFGWCFRKQWIGTALMLVFRRRTRNRNKKEELVLGDGKLSAKGKPGESLYIYWVEPAWVCLLTLEQWLICLLSISGLGSPDHWVTKWFELEEALKIIWFQLCHEQGHLSLDQVAQAPSQPGLDGLESFTNQSSAIFCSGLIRATWDAAGTLGNCLLEICFWAIK